MGQRLNIEIKKDDKVLANSYYHWAGYTSSALELTSIIIENLDNEKSDYDRLKAIRLLEYTGAFLTPEELNMIDDVKLSNIDFKKAIDRNNGLIAISEKGIKETQDWEEARVEIHLDTKEIVLNIYFLISEDDIDKNDTSLKFCELKNGLICTFSEFKEVNKTLLECMEKDYYGVIVDNEYFGFIQ